MNKHRITRTLSAVGLSAALSLGAGIAVTPQPASAATAGQSLAVYDEFQTFVNKPETLAHARNYLINHIGKAGSWRATVMTLQLENAQKAHLPEISERFYPQKIQETIDGAYREHGDYRTMTYTRLLELIEDREVRSLLMDARDKGYKLETSEGMYYPVMHYEGFKVFGGYTMPDITQYIQLMATESNSPTAFDGAIVISWEELVQRALDKEAFVKEYPGSNRAYTVKRAIKPETVFFGLNNTPAYDYDGEILMPELKDAYKQAIEVRGETWLTSLMEDTLGLLEQTDDKLTDEIRSFLGAEIEKWYAS